VDDRQPGSTAEFEPALPPLPSPRRPPLPRWLALLQTLLVCGIPTQVLVAVLLAVVFGMPFDPANLSFAFFATLSIVDTVLVLVLIGVFLTASGEAPGRVFLGGRPWRREAIRGLLLLPVVFLGVTLVVLTVRALVPWMHNVERNPLENFMDTPLEAVAFVVIVIVAGGVREELQRAFILHRFEQRLGGAVVGLVLFSAAFGLLHIDQGYDSAVGIGLLGLLWGTIFIRRGSVVAPMVNHASFNAAQVLQGVLMKTLGH
jgi:membrane protease YdiL (CAAX protease family)